MRKMSSRWMVGCCLGGVLLPFFVNAQEVAPQGIRLLDDRLVLSPYVNLEVIYDSNFNLARKQSARGELEDLIYRINPGVNLTYQGDQWGAAGSLWYSYNWYQKYHGSMNTTRWGERLRVYRESPKGWRFTASQGYMESDTYDALYVTEHGNGVWRNRSQFDANGALSYACSERLTLALNAMYSEVWYGWNNQLYGQLISWKQWGIGGDIMHKLTARSSVVLAGMYHEYYTGAKQSTFSTTSRGYTLQGGLMSRLTDRVRYRALVGASMYDYGGEQTLAPSYSLDASWVINKKWAMTAAGGGYFQPSEREFNQRKVIYTLALGTTYQPMKRVRLTLDGVYRHEDNQNVANRTSMYGNYQADQYTARFKANYQFLRYASVYGAAEYNLQTSNMEWDDWERYRLSLGLSLKY